MSKSDLETVLPIASVQEPALLYDPRTGRWSGASASFSVWMDDTTFRAYVATWYEWPTWLVDLSPEERLGAAVSHCRRLEYWRGCERNYDYRVHITYY
jgi:hypothetical protein